MVDKCDFTVLGPKQPVIRDPDVWFAAQPDKELAARYFQRYSVFGTNATTQMEIKGLPEGFDSLAFQFPAEYGCIAGGSVYDLAISGTMPNDIDFFCYSPETFCKMAEWLFARRIAVQVCGVSRFRVLDQGPVVIDIICTHNGNTRDVISRFDIDAAQSAFVSKTCIEMTYNCKWAWEAKESMWRQFTMPSHRLWKYHKKGWIKEVVPRFDPPAIPDTDLVTDMAEFLDITGGGIPIRASDGYETLSPGGSDYIKKMMQGREVLRYHGPMEIRTHDGWSSLRVMVGNIAFNSYGTMGVDGRYVVFDGDNVVPYGIAEYGNTKEHHLYRLELGFFNV